MRGLFDASRSNLGTLYQERYALYLGIQGSEGDPTASISLEAADDIEIYSNAFIKPVQLKHERKPITTLSSSFWKTIRVWVPAVQSESNGQRVSNFVLITTATVSGESAQAHLGTDARDPLKALRMCEEAIQDSNNQELAPAKSAFALLSPIERESLFNRIYVIAESPNVERVRMLIERDLRFTTTPARIVPLVDRLEGWWRRRIVSHLLQSVRNPIQLGEIDSHIASLRHEFDESNLPIDFADSEPTEEEHAGMRDKTFVLQLQLIGVNHPIVDAIRDYYKAGMQKSQWIREALVDEDFVVEYERRLVREWERKYRELLDDLGESDAESRMVELGKMLYKWAINEADLTIAPKVRDPYYMRGSFHKLADNQIVGWHLRYRDRLAAILMGTNNAD